MIVEAPDGRVTGIEVKAGADVGRRDVHHLVKLRDRAPAVNDDHDKPDPTRFGMTMTTDTQAVWLDDPGTLVRDVLNLTV